MKKVLIVTSTRGRRMVFQPKSEAARSTLKRLNEVTGITVNEVEVEEVDASQSRLILNQMKEASVWVNSNPK